MKFCFPLLISLGFLSGALFASDHLTDADAMRVLERIARAPSQTAFQGVYISQTGAFLEAFRVCHAVDNGFIQERRESLDGPAREMVRQGDRVSLSPPEVAQTRNFDPRSVDRLFPRLLSGNMADILANYNLRSRSRERIAGYDAEVFDLEPRDQLRYPHRLWVHAESGLLLKASTMGFKHEFFDLIAFSQLLLGAQVDRSQLKPVGPVRAVPVEPALAVVAAPQSQWDVKGIPAGFRLVQQSQRTFAGKNLRVTQYLYSDGVATVSVFLDTMQAGAPLGPARQGALSIFGRKEGSQHITVLGSVPIETAELFAKAYKLNESGTKK